MKIAFDFKIFSYQKFGGPSRYFFNLFENLKSINNDTYISSPFFVITIFQNQISKKIYLEFIFHKLNI